jgi:hypothetical protein
MRPTRALPMALLLGAFGLMACGDDPATPSGPSVAQFQGSWTASSIVYTNPDNSQQNLMAIVPGTSLTMNVAANGSFSGVFHVPGTPYDNLAMTGQISNVTTTHADVAFDWGSFPVAPINDFTASYTLSGNFLTFVNPTSTNPLTQGAASLSINMTR